MNRAQTVFIVDDDPGMRQSTGLLLESASLPFELFESAISFLNQAQPDLAGCIVLDLHMPGMSGMELITRLREKGLIVPILMVSGTGSIPVAVEGMKLGLFDFLVKPVNPDLLLAKVQAALDLDAQQRQDIGALNAIRARLATLTPREQELLALIVSGQANKNIATSMSISIKTVENHRANLMAKTGAANVADLVRMKMLVSEK